MRTLELAAVVAFLSLASFGCTAATQEQRETDCLDALADQSEMAETASAMAPKGTTMNGTTMNGTTLNGTTMNGTTMNGTTLNGTTLNGINLNGTTMNGTTLNGTTLNGTTMNGIAANGNAVNGIANNGNAVHGTASDAARVCRTGVRLEGTSFEVELPDGRTASGMDFVGAEFIGKLSDGGRLRVRIDDIRSVEAPNDDLLAYRVSYQTAEGWQPLCNPREDGTPGMAIPIAGRWDYRQGAPGAGGRIDDPGSFTFACEGYALSKCVVFGYRPWESRTDMDLAAHHEACVRMLRADFCGDGRSWTEDGTLINVYDHIGIQNDTESWQVEAEWTPQGARCLREGGYRVHRPECHDQLVSSSCGDASHFDTGSLLVTEIPSR